ncbi:IclR family transcriptional regulator [Thalassobacillus sp. CUG 92003]|uniref:IclR family transcriptional regulator n=1 Tax=Thalassobacillus sp. CUG 92003 TaxID=2736641 RepID=UPI0015E63AE7|nr:IclR family transcriptional regulator [Thalassobacillus sp. CUG 92003]
MREINVTPLQTVERAIKILDCFNFDTYLLTIDELVQKTGLAKATTYRLLWTLEKNGLITYEPKESAYKLGYKMLGYGGIVLEKLDIRQESEPYLKELHKETGFQVLLAEKHGGQIQYILKFDSEDDFEPGSYVGKQRLLHFGALGILFMAYSSQSEVTEFLSNHPIKKHTPYTVTDEKVFLERLKKIHEQGYHVDHEETYFGITSISVPVYDSNGDIVAAMAIAAPSFKLSEEVLESSIKRSKNIALKISERLGYRL